jgi:hypothetical protein
MAGKRDENARKPGSKAVKKPDVRMHPAGQHARPELTDEEATPGTGALPDMPKNGKTDPGLG